MCGRYLFTADNNEEIRRITRQIERQYGPGTWQAGEMRPTDAAPVLLADGQDIRPRLYSWGFRLPGTLVINARAETAEEKPLFRESVASRRCVIPSSGFYEWDAEKRKYLFTLPGESVLYMAGLYAVRDGRPCYCILTTAANPSMQDVHGRMPLVLRREQVSPWLMQPQETGGLLRAVPPPLRREAADAQMRLW